VHSLYRPHVMCYMCIQESPSSWQDLVICSSYTLNNAGLFEPKFGINKDKPKCWVKNVILTQIQLSLSTVHFLIAFLGLSMFDPKHFLECMSLYY